MQTNNLTLTATIFYIITLGVFLIAAVFPNGRVWGFNWWAFWPKWVPFALLILGVLVAIFSRFATGRQQSQNYRAPHESSDIRYYIIASSVVALILALFYLFRTQTHFLGDGYSLIGALAADNPYIKWRNFGGTVLQLWVTELLGDRSSEGVLIGYRVVAMCAGLLFLTSVALIAKKLFKVNRDRLMFLVGLSTGGYMLLYFGYVENYAMFVTLTGVFCLIGLLVANNLMSRWWIVPSFALLPLFHVFGAIMLPAAVYVFIADTGQAKKLSKLSRGQKWGSVLLMAFAFLVAFMYLYNSNMIFRLAFTPFMTDRFTVENYTLLSWKHVADYANLLFLMLPGFALMIIVLIHLPIRKFVRSRDHRFLLITLSSCWATLFVLGPGLGMPRDWDLFAFAGMPLVIFAYYSLINNREMIRGYVSIWTMLMALGLLSVGPRVVSLTNADVAISHLKNYFELDRIRNRNARQVLIDYYVGQGNDESAQKERAQRDALFPEMALANRANSLVQSGRLQAAIQVFEQIIRANPIHAWPYAGIALCHLRLSEPDSDIVWLEIANAFSHDSPPILSYFGNAYRMKGELDRAQDYLIRALKFSNSKERLLLEIISINIAKRNSTQAVVFLEKLEGNTGSGASNFVILGDMFTQSGFDMLAIRCYQDGIERGLDSVRTNELLARFPQLSR